MTQALSLLDLTVIASGAVARGRLVTFGGAQITAAGAKALGAAKFAAADGEPLTVTVSGTAVVEAGGAIAQGASVTVDASGRVVTASPMTVATGATAVTSSAANGAILAGGDPPQFIFGDALMAAGAAGAFIEVLLRR
jgi:hypothetical protein